MKKRAPYGRIKETTIGGFCMPREYRHIQEYEKEILELKSQGYTLRAIGEKLGFTYKQVHNFITRYNTKQRKHTVEISLKRKGRPRKDGNELPPSIQQLSKLTQLQYEIARKESKIKSLEMQVELLQDFLSHIERK